MPQITFLLGTHEDPFEMFPNAIGRAMPTTLTAHQRRPAVTSGSRTIREHSIVDTRAFIGSNLPTRRRLVANDREPLTVASFHPSRLEVGRMAKALAGFSTVSFRIVASLAPPLRKAGRNTSLM